MTIEVIDNFLPKIYYNKLNSGFLDDNTKKFNWFWNNSSAKNDGNFMFTHMLWDIELGKTSPHFETFEPIIYEIDKYLPVKSIGRMKLNLYTNQGKRINHSKHYDLNDKETRQPLSNVNITLLNFNTCNGGTVIDNKKYLSKENQAIMFNNTIEHYGFTQTNSDRRIILNIATYH